MPHNLRYVGNTSEIRNSLANFNRTARSNPNRSLNLIRQTKYWVFDEASTSFGPAKFVGFSIMSLRKYDASVKGDRSGDRFDGYATRSAIENVTSLRFRRDLSLNHRLVNWADSLLGPGVLDGIDDSKWRFLRI